MPRLCILSFFLLAVSVGVVPAQRHTLDSLQRLVRKFEQKAHFERDTLYLNLLHEVARAYDAIKPDSSLVVAQRFKELANRAKYPKGVSRALQDIGLYHFGVGNLSQALEYLFQALRIAEEIKHPQMLASCYNNIALVYHTQGKLDKALDYHFKVLGLRDQTKDEHAKAATYNNIGTIYRDKKDSKRSLENHFKSLAINEKYNDKLGISFSYTNIGNEYKILHKIDTAVYYLQKALTLAQELGDKETELEVLYTLAECELYKQHYEKALTLAEKSLVLGKELQKRAQIQVSYEVISKIYEAMGRYELALKYHKDFKLQYDSLVNSDNINRAHQLQAQHEYEKREAVLKTEQTRKLSEQRLYTIFAVAVSLFSFLLIAVLYYSRKRTLKANADIVKAHEEILKANQIILEQKTEIESQNVELEAQAEYLRDVNALKDRLLSIIGHDLKTPINQIKGLLPIMEAGALTKEDFQHVSEGIKQSLTHASDLLDNLFRWALSQLGGEMLKAQRFELGYLIRNNIDLYEPLADKKQITVINTLLDKTYVFADIDMIDLVIRNLLSNGIKFCERDSTIRFVVRERDNFIEVCVSDTGVGIPEEVLPTLFGEGHASKRGTAGEKGTGLGLTLCRDFIEKNGGNIWVESTVGEGSSFYFTVPKYEK